MLIVLQFPIADMRRFVEGDTGRIRVPSWPQPKADDEFIHSFGKVRIRKMPALGGWASENRLCMADRVLRIPPETEGARTLLHTLRFRVVFRTFFFNGETTGKFEIGIAEKARAPSDEVGLGDVIQALLDLPVCVPNSLTGKPYEGALADAGKALARQYLAATTRRNCYGEAEDNLWWVRAGEPVVVVERTADDGWGTLDGLTFRDRAKGLTPLVEHGIVRYGKRNVSTWVCTTSPLGLLTTAQANRRRDKLRETRIALLRIHAEREGLLEVLRSLDRGRLQVEPRSDAGQQLQQVLTDGAMRIDRDAANIPAIARAIALDSQETPGVRESVLDGMRRHTINLMKPLVRSARGLSGEQYGKLLEALTAAFDLATLAILVRVELDERLEVIAETKTLKSACAQVIDWAERMERVDDLVQGALRQNPNNSLLQALDGRGSNAVR
jgi:hypothetical protein